MFEDTCIQYMFIEMQDVDYMAFTIAPLSC